MKKIIPTKKQALKMQISLLALLIVGTLVQLAHSDFWPEPNGEDVTVTATIKVNASQTFDCALRRYVPDPDALGDGSEAERQQAVFELANGAQLENCIIGAASGTSGAADGVHCEGSCTLTNVWFEDVGEDAATFYGINSDSTSYVVNGGGARSAADKVFQFNGRGTATINDFWVDTYTRFVRTCGNCETQYERHVVVSNLTALNGVAGQYVVGINFNYGDTARLSAIKLGGSGAEDVAPCKRFVGVEGGGDAVSNGTGPDGTYCIYQQSDITYIQ